MAVNILDLECLRLDKGSHASPHDGMCVMEAVSFVAGEPWSDSPKCASPVIAEFLRNWNDAMNDEDRQQLKPYIPRLVGTKGSAAVERKRARMALDWLCRVSAPTWLRAIGKDAEAVAIEACAPIVDTASVKAAQHALDEGKRAAGAVAGAAARAAVRFVAGDAARDAAWAAARAAVRFVAWDAAGDAAWDAAWAAARAAVRFVAWDAAGDAAWAAAGDAAWAAARDALRPTVVTLQASALGLLDRLIEASA